MSEEAIKTPEVLTSEEKQSEQEMVVEQINPINAMLQEEEEINAETLKILKEAAIDVIKEVEPNIEEIIKEVKEEYGKNNVFMYVFDESEYYIFRTLKRFEFKKMKSMNLNEMDEEDFVFKTCVLHPKGVNPDELKSGSIRTIVELIFYYSNFGSSVPVIEL